MNKKLAQLTVIKSADYNGKLVKALEDAGFVLVQNLETSIEVYYIVAERCTNNDKKVDTNNHH